MTVVGRTDGAGRWARGCASLGALACLFAPAAALAQPEIPAEVFVVLAADTPGTIDARLSGMPGLRQPPFDGYGSMSLLELRTTSLAVGAPYDVTLPNGRVLRIAVEGVTDEGRYRVRVVINRPGETDYLPLLTMLASPGLPFFVAGQRMETGALIIAIRLGAASASAGTSTDPGASLEPAPAVDGRLSIAPDLPCELSCAKVAG